MRGTTPSATSRSRMVLDESTLSHSRVGPRAPHGYGRVPATERLGLSQNAATVGLRVTDQHSHAHSYSHSNSHSHSHSHSRLPSKYVYVLIRTLYLCLFPQTASLLGSSLNKRGLERGTASRGRRRAGGRWWGKGYTRGRFGCGPPHVEPHKSVTRSSKSQSNHCVKCALGVTSRKAITA